MKQILQSLKTGLTEIVDVPIPSLSPGSLLIKTSICTFRLVTCGL